MPHRSSERLRLTRYLMRVGPSSTPVKERPRMLRSSRIFSRIVKLRCSLVIHLSHWRRTTRIPWWAPTTSCRAWWKFVTKQRNAKLPGKLVLQSQSTGRWNPLLRKTRKLPKLSHNLNRPLANQTGTIPPSQSQLLCPHTPPRAARFLSNHRCQSMSYLALSRKRLSSKANKTAKTWPCSVPRTPISDRKSRLLKNSIRVHISIRAQRLARASSISTRPETIWRFWVPRTNQLLSKGRRTE